MVLHLGGNYVLPEKHVLAIIDVQRSLGTDTQRFTQMLLEQGNLVKITIDAQEPPKSLVISHASGRTTAYLSPISVQTLYKRWAGAELAYAQESAR